MKKLFVFGAAALLIASCSGNQTTNEAENQEETAELGKSYGEVEVDVTKAISVADMLNDFASQEGEAEYTFEADINEVCSKAGCWINVEKPDGETFMVQFKDHFTIPIKTEVGTGAYLHGTLKNDTVPVDYLKHFAEDAGKSQEEIDAITEPKVTVAFVADGITLKK